MDVGARLFPSWKKCSKRNVLTVDSPAGSGLSEYVKLFWSSENFAGSPSDSKKKKQLLYRLWGYQEAEAPRFPDSRHIKVVIAIRTGRLYLPGNIPGTHFC